MSTWLYLQCEDHDPPLTSEDVGQHLYDLPDIRRHIARRDSYAEMAEDGDLIRFGDHFGNHAYDFLTQHPRCTIGIVDEYGITYPLQEDTP